MSRVRRFTCAAAVCLLVARAWPAAQQVLAHPYGVDVAFDVYNVIQGADVAPTSQALAAARQAKEIPTRLLEEWKGIRLSSEGGAPR